MTISSWELRWIDDLTHDLSDIREDASKKLSNSSVPLVHLERMIKQIDRFLDSEEGMVPLLRHLPPHHLVRGSPLAEVVEKQARRLLEQTQAAVDLQGQVEALQETITERLVELFADKMPNLLRHHVSHSRLDGNSLRRVRRVRTLEILKTRLVTVEWVLQRAQASLDGDVAMPPELLRLDLDSALTQAELSLLLKLRLGERGRASGRPASRKTRDSVVKHLHDLGRLSGWREPRSATHTVAESLAHLALNPRCDPLGDGVLWTGMLGASQACRFSGPFLSDHDWNPRIEFPKQRPERPSGEVYHVLDLGGPYGFVTTKHFSHIRLWTYSQPKIDDTLEYIAFDPEDDWRIEPRLLLRNLRNFFTGLEQSPRGWYRTSLRGRLRVIHEAPGGWFAECERKGRLRRVGNPTQLGAFGSEKDIRILSDPAGKASLAEIELKEDNPESEFFGLTAIAATSDSYPDRLLWAKEAATGLEECLEREWELFEGLARVRADLCLRPVAWGADPRVPGAFPCYERPFALAGGHGQPVNRWISSHKKDLLRSVARVVVQTRELGYSLGLIHGAAFVYSMTAKGERAFLPLAIVAHAPYATPFGQVYPSLEGRAEEWVNYQDIGIRWLPRRIRELKAADKETDAQSFAVFALDLLASGPVKTPRRGSVVQGLRSVVAKDHDQFDSLEMVVEITESFEEIDQLWSIIQSLAGEA